jgi:methionine-gamma-lyase
MSKLTPEESTRLHPETLALSYGFDPFLSEGSVKPPVFLTSTFAFRKAEDGKRFFAWMRGEGGAPTGKHQAGLIYSRFNNPNLEIFEDRMARWEGMKGACSFSSGMAAISTALLATHAPGDEMIVCAPLYGGTETFMRGFLAKFGIKAHFIHAGVDAPAEAAKLLNAKTRSLFIESPANPNNRLTDIAALKALAVRHEQGGGGKMCIMVDNTMAGPVFSQPAKFGADVVLYSATKFIGGHSDVVGGVALADDPALLKAITGLRNSLGGMPNPHTAWLLTRSLETLKIRAEASAQNAQRCAEFLATHPKVRHVSFLGLLRPSDPEYAIYRKQHTGPGSLISLYIKGGEQEAFAFLDNLKVMKLAVSLGSTESLAQHPAAMTHSGLTPEAKKASGVSDDLVRISIGIENAEDLIWDLKQALEHV